MHTARVHLRYSVVLVLVKVIHSAIQLQQFSVWCNYGNIVSGSHHGFRN